MRVGAEAFRLFELQQPNNRERTASNGITASSPPRYRSASTDEGYPISSCVLSVVVIVTQSVADTHWDVSTVE